MIKKKDERKSPIMRWHSLVNLFMRPLLVRHGIPFYWISSGTNWDISIEEIFRFIDFGVDQCLQFYSFVYDLIKKKVLFTWTISFKYFGRFDFFDSHQISIWTIQSTHKCQLSFGQLCFSFFFSDRKYIFHWQKKISFRHLWKCWKVLISSQMIM
jgi:hypothetical protein